jgi:hypothetical protein
LEYLILQYFHVNFHFLNNDKSYNRDFFTIDTIDDGLSFHCIESVLSSNNLGLVLYTISGKHIHVYRVTWLNQRAKPTQDRSHLKEHIKLHRMAFSEFCGNELW